MEQFEVIKTTTERLSDNLNEVARDGRRVHAVQWVGGRDWIIISEDMMMLTAVGEIQSTPTTVINNNYGGWIADQDRRHSRLDASDYDWRNAPADISPDGYTVLIDPEVEWGDIRYGRYDSERIPQGSAFSGWIEDRARSWIIFLGEHGAPTLYWPRRDSNGGVIGRPVEIGR